MRHLILALVIFSAEALFAAAPPVSAPAATIAPSTSVRPAVVPVVAPAAAPAKKPEVDALEKYLDALQIRLSWKGLPDKFARWVIIRNLKTGEQPPSRGLAGADKVLADSYEKALQPMTFSYKLIQDLTAKMDAQTKSGLIEFFKTPLAAKLAKHERFKFDQLSAAISPVRAQNCAVFDDRVLIDIERAGLNQNFAKGGVAIVIAKPPFTEAQHIAFSQKFCAAEYKSLSDDEFSKWAAFQSNASIARLRESVLAATKTWLESAALAEPTKVWLKTKR